MKKHNIINLTTALWLSLLAACTSESVPGEDKGVDSPAQIVGSIGTASVVETKATPGNRDNISYESFKNDDEIGFFSTGGLEASNEKLIYDGSSFKSTTGNDALLWNEGVAQQVYAYFPYHQTQEPVTNSQYPVSIWRAAEANKWEEGFEDFLTASHNNVPNGSIIDLAFSHQFAMLMIERGTGFDENDTDIKVRLNYTVGKEAKINRLKGNALSLQVDEMEGVNELIANKQTYKPSGSLVSVPCWYVIIPVGDIYINDEKQSIPLTVNSVILKNDAGIETTIPLTAIPRFQPNTKYLVVAKMRDNQAVIEPEEIRRWEDESIEITKPIGIKTPEDFKIWMAAYNRPSFDDKMDILSRYGTYGKNGFTFLLLDNIDYTFEGSSSVVIDNFIDTLDGQGHTLSGVVLKGETSAGVFGELSGEVRNLKVKDILVEGTSASGNYGALVGKVTGTGKISNCHVIGDASFVVGAGNTGGLAGLLETGASITNSTSTAVVSGTGTLGLLVGQDNGATLTNCTSTGTIIRITNN